MRKPVALQLCKRVRYYTRTLQLTDAFKVNLLISSFSLIHTLFKIFCNCFSKFELGGAYLNWLGLRLFKNAWIIIFRTFFVFAIFPNIPIRCALLYMYDKVYGFLVLVLRHQLSKLEKIYYKINLVSYKLFTRIGILYNKGDRGRERQAAMSPTFSLSNRRNCPE